MKSLTAGIIALLVTNPVFADCDWKKIVNNNDGTYTYSRELHLCVGQLKQDLEATNVQLSEYKKAIDLKDLALSKSNERADLWMDTSFKLEDRLNKIDELRSKNAWIYFGLGALTVVGAGLIVKQTLR